MKKSTRWILFGIAAGVATGAGYYVYKNRDKFVKEEIEVTPDGEVKSKKVYVGLDVDEAKDKVNEAVLSTKKAALKTVQLVNDKINNITGQTSEKEDIIFEDFTSTTNNDNVGTDDDFVTFDIKSDSKADNEVAAAVEEVAETANEVNEEVSEAVMEATTEAEVNNDSADTKDSKNKNKK